MSSWSVVTAWRNRPELARTLEANAAAYERHGAEVVIVNCGGDPHQLTALLAGRPMSRLRHVFLPGADFNKSLANNIGALCSSGDFVFFLDADIVLDSDVIGEARPYLEQGGCFVKVRTVQETEPEPPAEPVLRCVDEIIDTRELVFPDGRRARLQSFRTRAGSRCGSGLMLLRRADLLAVGGFNSNLRGWGFDDLDLHIRLQLVESLSLVALGSVTHLTHGNDKRNIKSNSCEQDIAGNIRCCFDSYQSGVYSGSFEADVREWSHAVRDVAVTDDAEMVSQSLSSLGPAGSKLTG